MKNYVRKYLVDMKYFQNKRSKLYFSSRQSRNALLPMDERTSKKETVYHNRDKVKQLSDMMLQTDIRLRYEAGIQSWIDTGLFVVNNDSLVSNTSPDYGMIVQRSIQTLKNENYPYGNNQVKKDNYRLLCVVEEYIDRIVAEFARLEGECPEELRASFDSCKKMYEAMKTEPAHSVKEALQRIAFWSDLFWQSGHNLMGFGRLDVILGGMDFREDDNEVLSAIICFYDAMHRYYPYKSTLEAMGDTGQIIVLGGRNADGSYFCNRYTYLFIKALKLHPLPDPKLLLRVCAGMPDQLLRDAVELMATGVGSPLLANDDVIIPALIKFGYEPANAYNYITSACWEPLAYGNSSEVNNVRSINYAEAIVNMYRDEAFVQCQSFEDVLDLYKKKLIEYLDTIVASMEGITWEAEPLLTMFTPHCQSTGKSIDEGGARYNGFGLLGDGVGNTVNSLLLIRHCAFEEKKYSLGQLRDMANNNYEDTPQADRLHEDANYYGKDEDEVVGLTEALKAIVRDKLGNYTNKYGGHVKWGVSSSNYMRNGRETGATLDGRRAGTNLNVHISGEGVPYTELFGFASKLDYSGAYSNGNVVDYFVSPDLFSRQFDKMLAFIKATIQVGFFEQQMNVVSSKTLIDARSHPERYPNLIVRVWGFSAYFNDLTDDYKEVLIARALSSERAYGMVR